MLPKLSQKALDEIAKMEKYDTRFGGAHAVRFLFDLEKYPITKELIFDYLKCNSVFELVHTEHSPNGDLKYWSFAIKKSKTLEDLRIKIYDSVDLMLYKIIRATNKDKIIIIGEIHGWWEKGEQHGKA